MPNTDIIERMERQYQCRYELPATPGRSGRTAFPVTHKVDRAQGDMGARAAWVHICIGNIEVLNWTVYDVDGCVLVHGSEQNLSRTRRGYVQMIKQALRHALHGGAQRVYPRRIEDRKRAPSPWMQWVS